MLLMVSKVITGGTYAMSFINMQKLLRNIWKVVIKLKKDNILILCDVNNVYGWAMSQKLPLGSAMWAEETSQFNEDFIKSYTHFFV